MSDVRLNHWPAYASMANTLMNADMLRIDQYDAINDMTFSEMSGVEQVLLDRLAGIDASIERLMELRVRTNDAVQRIERVRLREIAELSDEEEE